MLKIPKNIEYALMAIKTLNDKKSKTFLSAKEISKIAGIPYQFTAKSLQRLMKIGLIQSHNGANGGYSLNTRINELTLLDFFIGMGVYPSIVDCSTTLNQKKLKIDTSFSFDEQVNKFCKLNGNCNIQKPLFEIQKKIDILLKSIKLSDIL
jgi:Rrf2 family protein